MTMSVVRTDRGLAQRLERAEALSNAAFVEARARLDPASGAEWLGVAGTLAMFDGVGSPLTQTFGFGLFSPAAEADLAELEGFFYSRGAEASHEVSPLADPAHLALFANRGYHPIEYTSILVRPLPAGDLAAPRSAEVTARLIRSGEESLWAETSAGGWGEQPELAAFMREFGGISVRSRGAACFVAELGGMVVAAGAMALHDGVALLAGASTIAAWRGRGAQAALLQARLRYATEQGADLAMMGALPGSTSQLNAERQGFRMAYTRVKWWRARQ